MTLQGKTVLITGGTGGIGKETALGLAKLGATVVVVGRDGSRGEAAVRELQERSSNAGVSLLQADLSSQASIRKLVEDFIVGHSRLDVLVNNVGGLYRERWTTADGVEATFAMNVLGPFLLTHLLLNVLKSSSPARVISVTGGMPTRLELDDLQAERFYRGLDTYSRAKAAMMTVFYEFAQRLAGTGVSVNVAYPGAAATTMTQAMTPDMVPPFMRVMWPLFGLFMSNAKPERAARSSVYLASSPEVAGVNGGYFNTNSKQVAWPKAVLDESARRQLWRLCERLTGVAGTPTSLLAETPASAEPIPPDPYTRQPGAN